MILLFIITSILYLIMIYAVLSLYYKYRKDIEEIENRCLQLEKRVNDNKNLILDDNLQLLDKINYLAKEIKELKTRKWNFYNANKLPKEVNVIFNKKEV